MMLGEKDLSATPRTDSQAEVSGEALVSVLKAMSLIESHARKILASYGLDPIDNTKWYPVRNTVEAFKAITKRVGPSTMKTIGRKILDHAHFPMTHPTLEEALASLDTAYRVCHRGPGYIGKYQYDAIGPRNAELTSDSVYVCEMDEGLLEAMGEKFKPAGSLWVRISHKPGNCRKQGAPTCTYEISW